MDATGPDFNWDRSAHEEPPNAEDKEFYDMLEAADAPLWEIDFNGETKVKCEKHTLLSAVTQLLKLKSDYQMSEDCFNEILSIIKSVLPKKNKLPQDFNQAKKLVEYKKIDVCKEPPYKARNINGKRVARNIGLPMPPFVEGSLAALTQSAQEGQVNSSANE